MPAALRVAVLAPPRSGARRPLAEVVAALEQLGFSTMGRSGGGDPALGGAGPDWIGGEQVRGGDGERGCRLGPPLCACAIVHARIYEQRRAFGVAHESGLINLC